MKKAALRRLYTGQMTVFLAQLLKPFVLLIVLGLICLPARLAVERWMKDGKLKRLLLRKL